MSERENTYPDGSYPAWTDYDWAHGPGQKTVTQPPAGLRQIGWDLNEIPPSAHKNDQFQRLGNALRYLGLVVPREFSTVKEGIDAVDASYLFRVHPPPAGMNSRGEAALSINPGNTIQCATTDGRLFAYGDNATIVKAHNPDTAALLWTAPTHNTDATEMDADGLNVYALRQVDATDPEICLYDPSDGSLVGSAQIASMTGGFDIKANGVYLCVAFSTATAGSINFYDQLTGNPNYLGQVSWPTGTPNAQPTDLAIDGDRVFVAGTRGGSGTYDVIAYYLSSRALAWNVTLPTTGPPNINDIATDGNFLYVVTNRDALSAGGYANLFVLSLMDGSTVWTMDFGSGAVANRVVVDDAWIYITTNQGTVDMYVVNKAHRGLVWKQSMMKVAGTDGISVFGFWSTNIYRRYCSLATRFFMRTAPADEQRRPFYNLAIPISEGI